MRRVITAIRFFKGLRNTGTHIGNLWTAEGTHLGSVTFTNETASGWQQATLSPPVSVAANTTYVVSYYAPNGFYAGDTNFFGAMMFNGGHCMRCGNCGWTDRTLSLREWRRVPKPVVPFDQLLG